jgi:hypothetical protein
VTARGVLIVTNEQDIHADFVVRELTERHSAHIVRLNTERADEWRLTVEPGEAWTVESDLRSLTSATCVGVWWRRPESPPRPDAIEARAWEAVCEQWRALLAGLVSVPGPRWISSPFAIRTAESKAVQLRHAADAGFLVPRTVWTNTRSAALGLMSEFGGEAICKSLAGAYWETESESHFIFARRIAPRQLPASTQLAPSPLAFQQMVVPKQDVRATVIGVNVIAAIRESGAAEEPIDWRLASEGRWLPHSLPAAVVDACVAVVNDLALRFAGIDLVLDDLGRYWFVELNPNGEWAWLQTAGLPIAERLASDLVDARTAC